MESTGTPAALPLAGLRVLECGDTLAAAYAGRLLSDLGAEVVKAERPEGDPLRALGPFVGGIPDADLSVSAAYFHAGKRSVLVTPPDDGELARLVTRADVVLRSTRDGVDWVPDELLADDRLLVVDVSSFGRIGRPGPHPTDDLLASAAAGLLSVNTWSLSDPTAGPLRYRGELASVHAACAAVLATLGALVERDRSGRGQRIDVSAQAAVSSVLATAMSRYGYTGTLPVRQGTRSVGPWGFYACADGTVLIQCTKDEEYRRLVELLGGPEWGELEIFATMADRDANSDVLDVFLGEALAAYPLEDFLAAAHRARVPAAPVHSGADVLAWDHLQARDSLHPVRVSDASRAAELPVPGPAWRFGGGGPAPRGPAPRLGESPAGSLWDDAATGAHEGRPPARRPLEGVRVIDLTWVWAGPYSTMQLAHLGAEVIRVETTTRVDVTRLLPPFADDVPGIDRSGYFNQYNQGKKSVALNLREPRGMQLLRQLVATADVVVDNMAAGSLARMGLPWEQMRELNPRLVAVSMTGFGESGPYADHMAYGSLIDALSGTAAANGPVGGGPADFVMSLPDPMAGVHTAIATVAAVRQARRTGVGTRVETAMLEACLAAFPQPVLYAAVGSAAPVIGNRDDERSPHGIFPCAGDDEWLVVSVADDDQWRALAAVVGGPELAADPRFADLRSRRVHESALEALVGEWAARQDAAKAADALRAAGVPAEQVLHVDEVFRSEPLLTRGHFTTHDHPVIGPRTLPGVPWVTSLSDMAPAAASPALGQHTREVLAGVLGLAESEIDELVAAGVTV
ncbi:CaiB/BaiF CoA-transferase family protein [Petropleomorpha daqingensis]|uniref:Crotonobetainyl-CoA:carnitine CoA-transferase CaiB-like acyl-CoA transferase n=1 Tax=Petropleomorpha daqingensis TaxID=2026353 RepID=A0A853CR92_9ACTN|nr:CoA transferase [Petropleomorpha daqingensis]NYJ08688.1 crotonobetainyl-CoA:carnitine CoA-transferase CaiB-like acyl-CoA transferase [Petropleomorpha daqingensis]